MTRITKRTHVGIRYPVGNVVGEGAAWGPSYVVWYVAIPHEVAMNVSGRCYHGVFRVTAQESLGEVP